MMTRIKIDTHTGKRDVDALEVRRPFAIHYGVSDMDGYLTVSHLGTGRALSWFRPDAMDMARLYLDECVALAAKYPEAFKKRSMMAFRGVRQSDPSLRDALLALRDKARAMGGYTEALTPSWAERVKG